MSICKTQQAPPPEEKVDDGPPAVFVLDFGFEFSREKGRFEVAGRMTREVKAPVEER